MEDICKYSSLPQNKLISEVKPTDCPHIFYPNNHIQFDPRVLYMYVCVFGE